MVLIATTRGLSLVLLTFVLFPFMAQAGQGHRIEVSVRGLGAEECYLAYHYGDRQFLKDSVASNEQGFLVFEGSDRLDPGMYMVVLPGQKYFEILVDHNQHFSLETSLDQLVLAMRFTDSPDNQGFYDYLRFLNTIRPEMNRLQEAAGREGLSEDSQSAVIEKMDSLNAMVRHRQDVYMETFPDGLFSKILLAQRDPAIPESFRQDGRINDQMALRGFYKDHYWDHINFSDDRLLRTPVYHAMLRRFFENFLLQAPDTIIRYGDRLIRESRAHPEVFRYTLWYLTNFSERSMVMGMDAVFVRLVENYYAAGEAFWMEETALSNLVARARKLKPLLVGKTAPDITMYATDGTPVSLHDVEAEFLVVYFWESECSYCQKETPALKELYETYRSKGLEVYAANAELDQAKWREAIRKYDLEWINVNDVANKSGFREKYDIFGIPLIFLLDSEKRIVAKQISVEQLKGFLLSY